jgi:DNA helicase-2/ATP-dependent DNA helicase PcrA
MNITFNEEQKEILNYKKGIMAISAVPGSGKTFILVHLAKKILETDNKCNILLLTYMNSAVDTFENRISSQLSKANLTRLRVQTIHSLAQEIVKENLEHLKLTEEYLIIDSSERLNIISNICKKWLAHNKKEIFFLFEKKEIKDESLKDFSSLFNKIISNSISKFKMESIDNKTLSKITKNYNSKNLLPYLALIYTEYQETLNSIGAIDYDDILFYAFSILKENNKIRSLYQEKFDYILEDEAQDSNKLQNKIIALITKPNGNLVKVGDPNQAITGSFTSASPELFRTFIKNSPIVKNISVSGRSNEQIIKMANYFHYYIKKYHPCIEARNALIKPYINPLRTGLKNSEPKLFQNISENEYQEINYLVYFIKEFSKKYPEKSIGVLLPRNSLISSLSIKFNQEKIDFSTLGDLDIETLNTLKKIGTILQFISQPYNNFYFLQVFKTIFINSKESIDKRLETYIKNKNVENIIYNKESWPEFITNSIHFQNFKLFIKNINNLLNFSINSNEKLIIYIGDLFNFNIKEKCLIDHIALHSKKLFKSNPKWSLKDLAIELKKIENNRFGFFASIINKDKNLKKQITITNYHKSKGMEWDMVYLFGINTFYFPVYLSQDFYGNKKYLKEYYRNLDSYIDYELSIYFKKKPNKHFKNKKQSEKIAESIRLIFVGITRAKEFLVISNNKEKDDFYIPFLKKILERIQNE